jgi:folate-binding protein YgfZ
MTKPAESKIAPRAEASGATRVATLDGRALLRIGGSDAESFLQGLVTCDVAGMGPGDARFGALLSPQGKILFDFFLVRGPESFLVDVAQSMRDDLLRRLAIYKLRAKVEIEPFDPRTGVHASWDGEAPLVDGIAVVDPRVAAMGHRLYCRKPPTGEAGDYEAHRIDVGLPAGGRDFAYGDAFPHEALMDQFGGISFSKGCFVGQEVVSRVQHRGTARSRIVKVAGNSQLPPPSTPVLAGGKACGQLGSCAGTVGLALVRLDRAAEAMAKGTGLHAGSVVIVATIPEWAHFDWPAVAGV